MAQKVSSRDLERKLGQQYATLLKEARLEAPLYRDCEDAIHASLSIMEYYNRITVSRKSFGKKQPPISARTQAQAFA